MSAADSLRRAASAIDDAKRRVRRLRHSEDEETASAARRVLRELEQAEADIQRAIRELSSN